MWKYVLYLDFHDGERMPKFSDVVYNLNLLMTEYEE